MKILVTFAVASEFAAWRRQHDFRQIAHEPFALFVSEVAGNAVRVVLTGMGTAAATEATCWALTSPADLCISSGFAGALNSDGDFCEARDHFGWFNDDMHRIGSSLAFEEDIRAPDVRLNPERQKQASRPARGAGQRGADAKSRCKSDERLRKSIETENIVRPTRVISGRTSRWVPAKQADPGSTRPTACPGAGCGLRDR